MTEEQIEIKSKEYAEGRGHEHYNFLFEENAGSPVDFARLCYADGLKDGATEATKELQEELNYAETHCLFHSDCPTQKENAELKEKLKPENCLKLLAKEGYIKFTSEQLAEAKEIIREFVEWANWQGNSKCPSFKSIQDKAEAFLKE